MQFFSAFPDLAQDDEGMRFGYDIVGQSLQVMRQRPLAPKRISSRLLLVDSRAIQKGRTSRGVHPQEPLIARHVSPAPKGWLWD
jgi:hypothetical protein